MDIIERDIKVKVALKYLELGLSVIPVDKDKKPLLQWKEFQERKATPEEVDAWFNVHPDANIGIVTGKISGICVVDFDTEDAYEKAKAKGLPKTVLVKTGRGYHSYFKYKNGVRNFQKRADMPGVDFRGDGGYVVAPPSVHESGHVYTLCDDASLDVLEMAQLPDWVLAKDESEKVPLKDIYQGVPDGERNMSLARIVGSMAHDGLTLDECMKMALAVNQKFNPPMSEQEVRDCTRSIFDKHQREKSKFDSNANSLSIAIEKKYYTIDELRSLKAEQVDWLWEGYLARGYITLLSGWPKAGKTTLLFQLIKAIKNNQPFLEFATKSDGKILIITEEHSQHYKVRVEEHQLSGDDVLILPAFERRYAKVS